MRVTGEQLRSELTARGLEPDEAARFAAAWEAAGSENSVRSAEVTWLQLTRDLLRPQHPLAVHEWLHAQVFLDWCPELGPAPAWFPTDSEASNLGWLMRAAGVSDYRELHAWSVAQPRAFWGAMLERLRIRFHEPYREVLNLLDGPEHPRWLVGGKLNLVESCFPDPDDRPAQQRVILVEGKEDGSRRSWTWGELRTMVGRVSNGLRMLGLKPGERIALYMPMTAESVAIYLGALAIGCPVVTIADSFAAQEIAVRLKIGQPAWIFTQDGMWRRGKFLPLYAKLQEIAAPPAIVIRHSQAVAHSAPEAGTLRVGDREWDDFLSDDPRLVTEPFDPTHFTTILFSSGTTGAPKAIPWDQTTPLKAAIDAHLHHDVRPTDWLCWPSNMGWMMGPWLVFAALLNRAAFALYDGTPTTRGFAEFIEQARVTILGLVPSLVSAWRASDCLSGVDWTHLRLFSSTGECSNPHDMFFLMVQAGYKPIIEYCGGTEIGGGYITGTVVQPAAPSTFSTPALGIDLTILDEQGEPAELGELFLVPPSMGLSQTLLNGDHHAIYYAGTPTGRAGQVLRRHGDRMQRFPNGYYRAHGRADDSMNLGGIKISSLQIEEVVGSVAGVHETAAIAVPPPGGGPDRLIVYAVLREGTILETQPLLVAMQDAIRRQLNPLFKLHDVVLIPALPRTASNKIMRRELRAASTNQERMQPASATESS